MTTCTRCATNFQSQRVKSHGHRSKVTVTAWHNQQRKKTL